MQIIRLATPADADSILEVYKPYVLNTAITFETEVPSQQEMQRRIQETLLKFPWLVLENEKSILGYAYGSPFKPRRAYDWSVESTVYIRQDFLGRGIGKKLYQDLIERLKQQGALNILGGISLPNEASVALHERLGFKQVAHYKEMGFKLEKWWDMGYWQLQFPKPSPFFPPSQ